MADFEVALTTDAVGDTFCISLWDLATGMQLKAYKGGCCPSRCVCLLGKDYIMASQVNKPIIHVWNTAKVNKYENSVISILPRQPTLKIYIQLLKCNK